MKVSGQSWSRRRLLRTGGASLVMAAAPRLVRAADSLTVADPGGPYGPAFRKAFYDPFEQATGVKVTSVAHEFDPGGAGQGDGRGEIQSVGRG